MSLFFLISLLLLSPYFPIQPTSSLTLLTSFNASSPPWLPTQDKFLVSPNSRFTAGFNPVANTSNSYTFSVWYNISITTPLWSITPNITLDNSSSLTISSNGQQLLLTSSSGNFTIPQTPTSNSTQLNLSNDGNLMFGSWKSFDIPTDTLLPNQNLTGKKLTSGDGRFTFDATKLIFNDSDSYWTTGNAIQSLSLNGQINQANGGTITSSDFGDLRPRRLTLGNNGNLVLYSFYEDEGQWKMVWEAVFELCKIHGSCGVNSICMSDGGDNTYCVCPPGFRPDSPNNYNCTRKIEIRNPANTKFEPLDYVNFTGGSNQTTQEAANLTDCEAKCRARSNCLGYMFRYDGSNYCVLQLDRLLYGYWSPGTATADVTFLRLDNSETDKSNFTGLTSLLETTCPVNISLPMPPDDSNANARNIAIISTLFAAELISGLAFFWAFLKKYIKYRNMAQTLGLELLPAGGPKRFTYAEIKAATNGFSSLIGKGGFGDVYKGELSDKRVVAVKCLKNVAGGDAEFWAEVTIIARMHHLNLVRLWGFCAEKGQRILVYEHVPNGSLDKYLFQSSRSTKEYEEMGEVAGERKPVLDWSVRYRIALGVARAIAYLHEECLEWVLHCDIKPENILLGDDFCPKISDFGLAKLRKKEGVVSMSRMRGTRGYMAPEWVKTDQITPKADVYSFGMVLLELVSGVRNFEMQGSLVDSVDWYLPGWAFDKAFKEMKVEDILDRQIKHAYDSRVHFKLVDRMVKTAMWCLQDRPELRPSMGKVAKMLEGTVEIMEPKKPTIFYLGDE